MKEKYLQNRVDSSCYYRLQRSWAKVIFSEACVKNSVHGGGGCGSVPRGVSPIFLGGCLQFFWGVSPNLGGCLQIFKGGVSKFLGGSQNFRGSPKFFFFFFQFLFPKKIPSGMHPPPTPRRSMRGQYASYWNAFLLIHSCRVLPHFLGSAVATGLWP